MKNTAIFIKEIAFGQLTDEALLHLEIGCMMELVQLNTKKTVVFQENRLGYVFYKSAYERSITTFGNWLYDGTGTLRTWKKLQFFQGNRRHSTNLRTKHDYIWKLAV